MSKTNGNGNGANLGFEEKMWLAADKMRNNMDSAEYKHVVLGLVFLKYISDGDIGKHNADSFHNDLQKTLKADFILANPPFNIRYKRLGRGPVAGRYSLEVRGTTSWQRQLRLDPALYSSLGS
ncbi:MAG: type I restriction-modification system subunit M N-terminal domain-containing protein [Clostridia bacterium]|jgi:type I restriction-modification system DNA methylase subunit|nr:type I restriction-modification system subunit M N-terminal domain-containing protein [Clostridia bacterium]